MANLLDNITNTIFSGPSYDEYSQARSDLYTNSPSKYSYDVNVNKAATDFATGRTKELLGDNPFTTGLTTAGTIAGIPLAIGASPFHEAIQAKERMEPGSGILGWGKAFLDEDPFSTAFNRGVGVASSGQVGQFGNWLGESIYDLTHEDDETGISNPKLRENIANKKVMAQIAMQKQIQQAEAAQAAARQAAQARQVRQNIQRYGGGDRPDTGMNAPGGGKGQSPTGGNVSGTPFNMGGLAYLLAYGGLV
jgi:hypothetical protein